MIPDSHRQVAREIANRLGTHQYARYTGKADPKYLAPPRQGNGKIAVATSAEIEAHIRGDQPIAMCALSHPAENQGEVLVFDLDDHDGTCDPQRMIDAVCELSASLGIPHVVERSGSGTGYHIWCAFDHPIRKDNLRKNAKAALARLAKRLPEFAFSEGTRGVAGSEVEIYPLSGGVGGGGLIAPPLGRGKSAFVQPTKDDDGRWTLPVRADEFAIELVSRQKPGPKTSGSARGTHDRDAAFDALAATHDPNDYRCWSNVGIWTYHAFPDDGWAKEKWFDWSRLADKPDPDQKLEKKWRSFADSPMSPSAFWVQAKRAGYTGPSPLSKREERKAEIDDLMEPFELLHGDDGIAYARAPGRTIAIPIESQAMRDAIRLAARDGGGSIKKEEVNELIEMAGAIARTKPRTAIALRFARVGGKVYVCHADAEEHVTEIDRRGFRPCHDVPVTFRRGRGEPLALPVKADPETLFELLNLDREAGAFAFAWALNGLLHPDRLSPILLIGGDPGSGKSTVSKALIEMLDPAIGAQAGPPKNEDDLVSVAHGNALLSFDNARTANPLADPLCRLATGGGIVKRKLYSDADLFALDVCRPILINGVDTLVNEQDLIARTLKLTLHKPRDGYGSNSGFLDSVSTRMPELTGAIFGLAARVLDMIDSVEIDAGDLRFNDYTRIGECVARILGFEDGWFVQAYRAMLDEAGGASLEGDAVARFVIAFCHTQPPGVVHVEASATELIARMVEMARNDLITVPPIDMPPNPRAFSARLNRVKHDLEKFVGIRVREGRRTSHARALRFDWDGADLKTLDDFMRRYEGAG